MSNKLNKGKNVNTTKPLVLNKYLIAIIGTICITILFGILTIKKEYTQVLSMFLGIGVLGLSTFPMTYKICQIFKDKGYFISKSIGILINAFIVFAVSSLSLMRYELPLIIVSLILVILVNWVFIFPKIKKSITKEELKIWIIEEVVFLVLLTVFSYIRGFKNEISQTEKYMDYGIIMSCFKAKYFPIEDMWFSGRSLNYYYYGQYILSYLIKATFGTVEFGYNICLSVIIAMSSINFGTLALNILEKVSENKTINRIFAWLVPIFTFFTASCHYLIYGVIRYWKDDKSYIVYDSTRYIGYNPDVTDKTIHEFPSYGFLLGDAHAYTINTIFVTAIIFLLFVYLYQKRETLKDYYLNPTIILIGFFIGHFQMINYWDFPIYFVVSGAIILFSNIKEYKFNSHQMWRKLVITLLQGSEILIIAIATSFLFLSKFTMISSEIKLCQNHSLIYQLFILWGFFLVITLAFIIKSFLNKKDVKELDIAMILISICGLGLVLLPEIIYVKDIYEGGYSRANTMFKLTYQAYILLSLSNVYFIFRMFLSKKYIYKIIAILGLSILVINTTYVGRYIQKDYGNIFDYKHFDGLDGTRYLKSFANSESYLIEYINEFIPDRHRILEASGESYSTYNKISAFTGNSTIYGWDTHESLWNNYEEKDERLSAIDSIYTSKDEIIVKNFLKKYNIEYIVIGTKEIEKYGENLNFDIISSLGTVEFSRMDCRLIKINQELLYK